jgi:hypothetical protein
MPEFSVWESEKSRPVGYKGAKKENELIGDEPTR